MLQHLSFISLYCWIIFHCIDAPHLSTPQLRNIWVVPTFWKELCIIHVQAFVWTYVFIFLPYIPRSGVARSCGNSDWTFGGTARLFAKAASPFYIPTDSVWGFQFLHILTNACCYLLFLIIAILVDMKCYLTVSSFRWLLLMGFVFFFFWSCFVFYSPLKM